MSKSNRFVPTEEDLRRQVKLVEIVVDGDYIARIDEKRKTSRTYKTKLLVPEGFNKSDIKRLLPHHLRQEKEDFIALRTFYPGKDAPKKTEKKSKLGDLYSARELAQFKKWRDEAAKAGKAELAERASTGDISRYGDDGLPPVINDD